MMDTTYGNLVLGSKTQILSYFRAHFSKDIPSQDEWVFQQVLTRIPCNFYYIDDFIFITVLRINESQLKKCVCVLEEVCFFPDDSTEEFAVLDAKLEGAHLKSDELIYDEKHQVYLFQLMPLKTGGANVRMWRECVYDDHDDYYYEVICISLLKNPMGELNIKRYFRYPSNAPIIEAPLPEFKYHPYPLENEVFLPSQETCICCKKKRGYVYTLPLYCDSDEEYIECICPWCIADGSAARKFRAEFVDVLIPSPEFFDAGDVPAKARRELSRKTPNFDGAVDAWYSCCNDIAEYLGPAYAEHTQPYWPAACGYLKQALKPREDLPVFLDKLKSFKPFPTAQIFRCRHCRKIAACVDTG